jgi:hypothetical protein
VTKEQLYLRLLAGHWEGAGHKTAASLLRHIANRPQMADPAAAPHEFIRAPGGHFGYEDQASVEQAGDGLPSVLAIRDNGERTYLSLRFSHDGGNRIVAVGQHLAHPEAVAVLRQMAKEKTTGAPKELTRVINYSGQGRGRRPKLDTSEPEMETDTPTPEDFLHYGRRRYSQGGGMTKKQMAAHILAAHLAEQGRPWAARLVRHAATDPHRLNQRYSVYNESTYDPEAREQFAQGRPVVYGVGGLLPDIHDVHLVVPIGDQVHSVSHPLPSRVAAGLVKKLAVEGVYPGTDAHTRLLTNWGKPEEPHSHLPESPAPTEEMDYQPTPEDFLHYARGVRRYAKPAWWPGRRWSPNAITHETVDKWLGKKAARPVSANKRVYRGENGDIHLRLHQTDVVTWHPDGTYTIRTGGWHTPTTRAAIAAAVGTHVSLRGGRIRVGGQEVEEGGRWPVLPQAPEVDYRPSETIPEDYYALARRGGKRKYGQPKPRSADFLTAVRILRGAGQKKLHAVAADIARGLGLDPAKTRDALLDGPAGAHPGVAQAVAGADPDTARYAAAWYGLLSRTPALGLFHVRPKGPDSLYKFHVRGSAVAARRVLDRLGLHARVLMPAGAGYDIVIPDAGRRQRQQSIRAADSLGGRIEESVGKLEPLGHADPAKARHTFRKVVEKYEGAPR